MNLLNEIKVDLVNSSIYLSDVLRKAKVLAYELQSEEMKSWVELELNGYENIPPDQIPAYRKISTQSFGQFIGPFGSGLIMLQSHQPHCPTNLRTTLSRFTFVKELVGLKASSLPMTIPFDFFGGKIMS